MLTRYNNIKAVVFDVDDTLIYTIESAYNKTKLAGKQVYNIDLKKNDFLKLYGVYNFEDCVRHWYGKDDIKDFIEIYNKIKIDYKYISDLNAVVNNLKNKGILVGIVTNSTIEKTNRKLKEKINLFDFVYCDANKPDEKVFLDIMKNWNMDQSEILYIGDSDNDYLTTKKVGINFCAVNTGKKDWNKQKGVYFIKSINEISEKELSL